MWRQAVPPAETARGENARPRAEWSAHPGARARQPPPFRDRLQRAAPLSPTADDRRATEATEHRADCARSAREMVGDHRAADAAEGGAIRVRHPATPARAAGAARDRPADAGTARAA